MNDLIVFEGKKQICLFYNYPYSNIPFYYRFPFFCAYKNRQRTRIYPYLGDMLLRSLAFFLVLTHLISAAFAQSAGQYARDAFAQASLGNYEEAVELYEKAIRINRHNASYHYYKAICQFEVEDYEGSVVSYDRAIILNSGNHEYYFNRGKTLLKLERVDDAINDFSTAIMLHPGRGMAEYYYLRGIAKATFGDHVWAIEDFDIAISLEGRVGDYYRSRGECKVSLGQIDSACQDFREAAKRKAFNAKYFIEKHCQGN